MTNSGALTHSIFIDFSDSYVAVCGLPQERKDHAVVMAKFAMRCNIAAQAILRKLEIVLGPGTAGLGIRYGLHSGQTTGGVLRGEKARFQVSSGVACCFESSFRPP